MRRLRGAPAAGVQPDSVALGTRTPATSAPSPRAMIRGVTTLSELASAGDAIAGTSSKSEKVRLLARVPRRDRRAPSWRRPRATSAAASFPPATSAPCRSAAPRSRRCFATSAAPTTQTIRAAWRRHSDTGDVTGDLLSGVEGRETAPIAIARARPRVCGDRRRARCAKSATALLSALLEARDPERGALHRQADHRRAAHRIARGARGGGDRRRVRRRHRER